MKADPARLAHGWLTLEISGERPERLLNLALARGLELTEVRWLGPGRLQTQLPLADFRRLVPLARQTRCRLHIRRRQGLPFCLAWLRRRPLLPLAALLFLPLLAFLCSVVAQVEVTSPEPLDPRETVLVEELARQAGVRAGRSLWTMDLEQAETAVLRGFPRLIYCEILRHGNRLEIAVVRRIDVAEEEKIRPAGDLVAAAAGVIVDVLVQRGTAQVAPGDRVRPGQVLISGEFAGDYLGAVGIVTARVYGEGYGEGREQEVELRPSGRRRQQVRLALSGGDGSLLLGDSRPWLLASLRRERRQLCLWRKIPLPVEIILIEVAELDPRPLLRDGEQAREAASALARRRAELKLRQAAGGELLSEIEFSEQLIELGDGVCRVQAVAWATADIGSFRPLSETDGRTGAAQLPADGG